MNSSSDTLFDKEHHNRLRITCCGYSAALLSACCWDRGSGLDLVGEVEDWAAGRVSVPDPGCHGAGQDAGAENDL